MMIFPSAISPTNISNNRWCISVSGLCHHQPHYNNLSVVPLTRVVRYLLTLIDQHFRSTASKKKKKSNIYDSKKEKKSQIYVCQPKLVYMYFLISSVGRPCAILLFNNSVCDTLPLFQNLRCISTEEKSSKVDFCPWFVLQYKVNC